MPILDSYNTPQSSTTTTGTVTGTTSEQPYIYSLTKLVDIPANNKFLLVPGKNHAREITIDFTKPVSLFFGADNVPFTQVAIAEKFRDNQLGTDLHVWAEEACKALIVVRSLKPIDYPVGEGLMIPVRLRLAVGTGENYTPRNPSDFDATSTQYLVNLQKLKDSDSGVTGWKVFDLNCFYPGKPIEFSVAIEDPTLYGNVAVQLFDPLSVAESIFDVANDVVNLELNDLGTTFIGNVTRNALYVDVTNDKAILTPDFSRHIGRFVALNNDSQSYDTAIIKSYTPNTDIYKGGTFMLTGQF